MSNLFSIGEWVRFKSDGTEAVVKRVLPLAPEGPVRYIVDTDPQRPKEENRLYVREEDLDRRFHTHAHIESESRDCDGKYTSGRVDVPTLAERCDVFGELVFKDRILTSVVTIHGSGTLSVTPDGLEWHEDTDEGYRREDVRWCEEQDCPDMKPWQRDHTAESMGY